MIRIEAGASSYTRGRFARSLLELGAAGLVVIAIAAGVGVWLSRRLSRPIEELRTWASERHRAGHPTQPPDPTGIVELDALRGALVEDQARITELLRRERSFSSQVSHQLRTPVAAMRVAIETELESPRPDPASVLDESLDQLNRLESTINSLLALARHDSRPPRETELLSLVEDRIDVWRRQPGGAGRTVTVTGHPSVVRTDPDMVGHIVDVLVDNALRHGSGPVRVAIDGGEGSAVIDVADDGLAPRAHDPFADHASDTGHGIGLRLARSLAESAGGSLELLPGPTTTFRLTLAPA